MPGLAHYMAQYDHEHSSGWNKLLHGVGIPMIFLDLGSDLFCRRLDFSSSWSQDRGKPSGVFSGTNLFAGRTNLGGERSMGVPKWNAP
jgi:hypothetical protein